MNAHDRPSYMSERIRTTYSIVNAEEAIGSFNTAAQNFGVTVNAAANAFQSVFNAAFLDYVGNKPENKKAFELLKKFITKEQAELFKEKGYVECLGKSLRRYRIFSGMRETQIYTPNGELLGKACVVPDDMQIPSIDWLVQRLVLVQADEARFYKLANTNVESPYNKIIDLKGDAAELYNIMN